LAAKVVEGLGHLPRLGPGPVASVLRFIKIEHNLFSLPLLLAGAWLGAGSRMPSWTVLGWIVVAGVGARALGMAMNRIFDRHLDARNKRTADRELPTGRMSLVAGLVVAVAGLAVYLLACWALGPLCLKLSPIPAAVLIGYSLLKRFTSLCHFGIGLCLALAPLCAFVATSGKLDFTREILLLALFTFCWISGFDIIYALQDLPYDKESGVWSLPVRLGAKGAAAVAAGVHLVAAGAIIWLWLLVGGGFVPGLALAVALAALAVGHCPLVPLPLRFFPTSAVACLAGALIPLLGGWR
jgi:4-hydroxybenzoate polyprenyltransferase